MNSDYNFNKYNKSNKFLMNCDENYNKYSKSNEFLNFFDFETIGMDEATFHSDRSNVLLPMVSKSKKPKHSFDLLYLLKL